MAEHPAYPVGLRLTGRRVVVLGGGEVAQRRLPALIAAGADITLVSPEVTPSVEAMADAGELTWERRPYADGDLTDIWYALIATSDHDANTRASAEAERNRVWCVRSDDADEATAWTPATGHSEGVTVAVLTTDAKGRDPRHTAAIRDAVVEGLRDGTLVAPHHRTRAPGVALVGGGPGDPDLITVRGRRLLAAADVVITDHLGPRDLLTELPPNVEVIDAAKLPYGRFMAQEAINNALIEHAKQGKSVVRLKGGDPFVYGRGMEEVQALAEAGIACTVVPGISSSISVPGAAGIPVTHRGVAHEFTVVSGHIAPDDERSLVDWPSLAKLTGTLVILMGVATIGKVAETLIAHGKSPDT
ncbi:uroporphyrinogen-III C-methyltransferase, partial [Streptomyces sp. NPDC006356]